MCECEVDRKHLEETRSLDYSTMHIHACIHSPTCVSNPSHLGSQVSITDTDHNGTATGLCHPSTPRLPQSLSADTQGSLGSDHGRTLAGSCHAHPCEQTAFQWHWCLRRYWHMLRRTPCGSHLLQLWTAGWTARPFKWLAVNLNCKN